MASFAIDCELDTYVQKILSVPFRVIRGQQKERTTDDTDKTDLERSCLLRDGATSLGYGFHL